MQTTPPPSQWLSEEYLQRRRKNPAYSLRAFSRLLDLPSGRVSQLLSQKRRFTPKMGKQIATQLSFDPERTNKFLESIQQQRKKAPLPPQEIAQLDMDQFDLIAEPVHFSILSLLETKKFTGAIKDIATRLRLGSVEARAACERLVRVGLAHFDPQERLQLSQNPGLATPTDIVSSALKRAHQHVLEESIKALEEVPIHERDITSITMAVDSTKLPEAKKRIREFRRSLAEFLESGDRTEVFRLNVQLLPITRKEK